MKVEGSAIWVLAHGKDWSDIVSHDLEDQRGQLSLNESELLGWVVSGREHIRGLRTNLVNDMANDHVQVEEDLLDGRWKVVDNGGMWTNNWAFFLAAWHAGHDSAAAALRADLSEVHFIAWSSDGGSVSDSEEGSQGE